MRGSLRPFGKAKLEFLFAPGIRRIVSLSYIVLLCP
jgi:hypothetical protein